MLSARRLIERLSRGVVLKRRLPPEFGCAPILVSPDAGLRFWRLSVYRTAPELFDAARELVRPGDVVWDVGAAVGQFAFAAAALTGASGHVLAVEPDLWLVSLLRRSARMQPPSSAPVVVLPVAVAERIGVAEFCIAQRGRGSNYLLGLGGQQTGGERERQWVITVTLDWLLGWFPAPAVLKIDIEGAEVLARRGAERVLGEVRPRLLLEVHDENADEVGAMLRGYGYRLFDAEARPEGRTPLSRPAYNTLALPG
jgi:FkbM family methyltransferase